MVPKAGFGASIEIIRFFGCECPSSYHGVSQSVTECHGVCHTLSVPINRLEEPVGCRLKFEVLSRKQVKAPHTHHAASTRNTRPTSLASSLPSLILDFISSMGGQVTSPGSSVSLRLIQEPSSVPCWRFRRQFCKLRCAKTDSCHA